MYMCPIPNDFRNRGISLYSYKIVDKKGILRNVSNAGIYCSSEKLGTVYLVIPPSTSMHCASSVRTWRVARLCSEIALSRKPFGIEHTYICTPFSNDVF
jgi:hypothetical protein